MHHALRVLRLRWEFLRNRSSHVVPRLSLPLENAFGLTRHLSGVDLTRQLLLRRRGFLCGSPARSKATETINKRKWSQHQIRACPCPRLQPSLAPLRASRLSRVTGELAPTRLDPSPPGAQRGPSASLHLRLFRGRPRRRPADGACHTQSVPGQLAEAGPRPHRALIPLTPVQKPTGPRSVT